jgi:ubiquinone/menaquinone biosynthesis C-methylase UbiE
VSFDAIAPWYRTLETIAFGNALQRARVACLKEIGHPGRALIVGEGNGRFLGELVRAHPSVEVDCVDASRPMLDLARKQVGPNAGRVRFLQHDIASWTPPPGRYDLIVSHFVLDCFQGDRLDGIIGKLSKAATADASWLLADFRVPEQRFARLRARIWLAAMYRFFRIAARIEATKLVDPSPFLRSHGFTLQGQFLFRHGLLKSELWRKR